MVIYSAIELLFLVLRSVSRCDHLLEEADEEEEEEEEDILQYLLLTISN